MDSNYVMYQRFAEMTIDGFHCFLSEVNQVEPSDWSNFDCYFIDKLRDIDKILHELFEKSNSSTLNVQSVKEISATPVRIVKRKYPDSFHHTDAFKRTEKCICRNIAGSDDSVCEMRTVPVSSNGSKDLFQTDYPDECFQISKTREAEACHQDASSSKSPTDDPYVTKITSNGKRESSCLINDQNYPYIVKVSHDFYQCMVCSINTLSKNEVISHIKGRQHRLTMQKKESEHKPEPKVTDSWIGFPKIEDKPIISSGMYECTLCSTFIVSEENAMKHINGKRHKRKLEILG